MKRHLTLLTFVLLVAVMALAFTSCQVVDKLFNKEEHTHSFTSTVTKEATCTEDGTLTFSCDCGEGTYTKSIPALGHPWGAGSQTKDPTCEDEGEITYICKNDPTHTEIEKIPALGHKADTTADGVSTNPTATKGGFVTYPCSVDGCDGTADVAWTADQYMDSLYGTEAYCFDGYKLYIYTATIYEYDENGEPVGESSYYLINYYNSDEGVDLYYTYTVKASETEDAFSLTLTPTLWDHPSYTTDDEATTELCALTATMGEDGWVLAGDVVDPNPVLPLTLVANGTANNVTLAANASETVELYIVGSYQITFTGDLVIYVGMNPMPVESGYIFNSSNPYNPTTITLQGKDGAAVSGTVTITPYVEPAHNLTTGANTVAVSDPQSGRTANLPVSTEEVTYIVAPGANTVVTYGYDTKFGDDGETIEITVPANETVSITVGTGDWTSGDVTITVTVKGE